MRFPRTPGHWMLAVTLACAAAGSVPDAQTPAQSPQQPTFRLDANFVRVDVYPTLNGAPVTDLTKADFEVLEDGVPQDLETFEHVEIPLAPVERQRDPGSVREMRAAAENPRARVFVIFLDTFHTGLAGSHRMQRSLVTMIDRMLSADDLFAVMTPYMSPSDLAFGRKSVTVEGFLRRHWTWGVRDRLLPEDPTERRYIECYPSNRAGEVISPLAAELITRRREKFALDALKDVSLYLRGVREERKAVIAVTDGWLLPRERRALAGPGPEPGNLGTTPDGRLTTDVLGQTFDQDLTQCERDRQLLAYTDVFLEFRDLIDIANRSNVSIYPVASGGLAATDVAMGPLGRGGVEMMPAEQIARVRSRVESLRTVSAETDGVPVVETNDIDRGLRRIVADMTSYYLLGYYTKNAKLDGRFREIKVRVTRPGVEVRARRGYRAATAEELRPPAPMTKAGPPPGVQAALASIAVSRPSKVRTSIGFAPRAAAGGPIRVLATVEIDASSARGDFARGADVALVAADADGTVLGQGRASLEPGVRSALVDLGELRTTGSDFVVRTRAKPAGEGSAVTEMTTVPASAQRSASAILWRRGSTTAMRFVPTAEARFTRADRVRAEVLIADPDEAVTAVLLDRAGAEIAVPVAAGTRIDAGRAWATAELALAPLAPADYVLRMTLESASRRVEVFAGIKVVP